jgi:hypothetical protein
MHKQRLSPGVAAARAFCTAHPLDTALLLGYRNRMLPLTEGGFQRDYGVEGNAGDQQTAHSTWTTGMLYAHGLEEAPGHVESRRAGFRHVSRQWHGFLGFSVPQVKRKLPFQDVTNV